MSAPWMFPPTALVGGLWQGVLFPDLPGARTYTAFAVGDGLDYHFPAGTLTEKRWLSADVHVEGRDLAVFRLEFWEAAGDPFILLFGVLNHCQARVRIPLAFLNSNRWSLPREGAWLKPRCRGAPLDPEKITRLRLALFRKGEGAVLFALTDFAVTGGEPLRLLHPKLTRGVLLDELGQSTLHDWPTKTTGATELIERLRRQGREAPSAQWPAEFSRWGGWRGAPQAGQDPFQATGFFRLEHNGKRWWLADPDGFPFWSSGLNCVRPKIESSVEGLEEALAWKPEPDGPFADARGTGAGGKLELDFLVANLIRAFGGNWRSVWPRIALAQVRALGFNTVANWSAWEDARASAFPYVRALALRFSRAPLIFRDFPDVEHPGFAADCGACAEPLSETSQDPALVGYFLMNEPQWGFASQTPAEGMLLNTPRCETRKALARFLQEKYGGGAGLARAWKIPTTLEAVACGPWALPLSAAAREDLTAFSARMAEKLLAGLSAACRRAAPHHLNLGVRYHTVPPDWTLNGMRTLDVFSMNCYGARVKAEAMERISGQLGKPVLVGEWHFGALDAGLPASGIGRVENQAARGKAFRVYLEDAAAKPWCVGAHYFTLYDESAVGRFDGENYNIGFLDVCHRPYHALARAARESHARLYGVACGGLPPYGDVPDYLPPLF